jgi:phospholipid/cholesterol/gamma-HCH transport system permease protein
MQVGEAGWELRRQGDALVLEAHGSWLVASAGALDRALRSLERAEPGAQVRLDLGGVAMLDTVGAWLVLRTRRALEARGVAISIDNVAPEFAPLLDQVAKGELLAPAAVGRAGPFAAMRDRVATLGARTIDVALAGAELVGFLGLVVVTLARSLRHPSRVRLVSLVAQVQRTGVTAVPIVGLLSFLIGIVIAFQSADQLRRFGAELFTINLLGLGMLRELAVLLTAIITAGRSGSAFTAELGAMEVNEEIDAMRTLGLDPIEILVLPRLLGLMISLPLLAAFADFMGLLGGAVMCWGDLGIPPLMFVRQLHDAIAGWTFWVGILKAPFFAATIALVGCHAGLQVSGSAESVGRLTTLSVVRSIFLVIVIDAVFSILFSSIGI